MNILRALALGLIALLYLMHPAAAQTRFWLKKQGADSLLQIAYYVDYYERDEGFNGTYWTEGGRMRFNFPHGTNQFKTGLVKGWLTHREFQFMDEKGNHRIDSVLWAEGQMIDFLRVGTWRKYHLNGKVALEVNYCQGQPCGVVTMYHETGAIKTTGEVDEKGWPNGFWRGEFPSGKPKFEVNYEHGVNKGWSKHYTEEGLFSEVHFTDNQWSSYYDSLTLYYPETGRLKARIERKNTSDKIVEAWDEEGNQTVFNSSGTLSGVFPMFDQGYVDVQLRDGRPMGEETRYFDKEKKKIRSRTLRNAKDSMRYFRTTFYQGGQLEFEFGFVWQKEGDQLEVVYDGPFKHYYPNAQPAALAEYKNGLLCGTYQHWNPAGILVQEYTFACENITDQQERLELEDASLSGIGVPNGICRVWNDAGVLIQEESYLMGQRDGVWKTWHANGQLASEKTYKNDLAVGKPRYYDEQGKKIKAPTDDCPTQNWGSGFVCSKHQNEAVIDNIGSCSNCGEGTSSGMYSLCAKCACRLKKCQRCGKDL